MELWDDNMKIIFLGTNGWFATKLGYTACVLVETPKEYIFLDTGTGFSRAPLYTKEDKPVRIFLSHFHLDHIIGFFWLAAALPKKEIEVYGQPGTEKVITTLIDKPFFPVPLKRQQLRLSFHELKTGHHRIHDLDVMCDLLEHSDPVYGYRINNLSYCTDTKPCQNSVKLSQDAELLIHECSFKEGREGGSHSRPSEAAKIASEAKVKRLILFHFDASVYSTKREKAQAARIAGKTFANTAVAEDSMEVVI
jgi:ribonuclease BN (tRNA processing enzyme)